MAVSSNDISLQGTGKQSQQNVLHKTPLSENAEHPFSLAWLKECLQGILVFTDQQDLVYASDDAYQIVNRLHGQDMEAHMEGHEKIPEEIWHICQSLIQSRHRFPHQNWLMEFDIVTQDSAIVHIRSRWLKENSLEYPYLILLVEDRQQAVTNILMEEARKCGFTPREKQVWMLHRNSLTYKQIAKKLGITPNTVKKHMRSIHAKRKPDLSTGCTP
ncbi:helix-turn-helix transcriptional regulator [Leptothoe sp. PORK10 BA2]|uniref:helix-turn-helix transcriptional regulator n=1 Tax=Leptothoe sp. PORK10 BA2 TaxID=3110254 RepID=UPI002B1FEAD2|nr:helix-turn-helix transcriptional regulator [Leptothoe sp. PORK10 BA2]MEA5462738.1 helix-turn-helix transcriptional regulator [Leptothoe sp. PORK10 BA2]